MASKYGQNTNLTAQNQLVQWINEAGMAEGHKKSDLLRKIIEVILHQTPQMIPEYMENIISYVNDKSTEVKKQVIAFIEEISKLHPKYLPKVTGQLRVFIVDSVVAVQKRVIQAASIVYRNALLWMCKEEANVEDMKLVWEHLTELKLVVLNMIDSDNEGIRTHSIKFLEEVVLRQSAGEGCSLDALPPRAFLRRAELEEEADHIFNLLVKFHNSQHISSVNLMACMSTLCMLAKVRPKYLARVIQALGDLHTTLPPTLSQSQVNSVRKQLKMLLVNFIKHPSSNEMLPQLIQLLLDIGMTSQEINKAIPKDRRNKRIGEVKSSEVPSKRFRVDSPQSNSQGSDSNSRSEFDEDTNSSTPQPPPKPSTPTEDSLAEGLDNVENVVKLVMASLLSNLPNTMPEHFLTAYKPIPNSGTKIQKRELAKMILAIKNEPAPPRAEPAPPRAEPAPLRIEATSFLADAADKIPMLKEDDEKVTLKNAVAKLQESTKAERKVESAVSKLMEETRQEHLKEEDRKAKEKEKEKEKLIPPQTPTVPKLKQKVKLLKLQEITRPIPKEIKEKLMVAAVARILRADRAAAIGGAAGIRGKFLTIFASSYTPQLRDLVLDYILEAPAERIELALAWLYEEYAFMQGFNRHPVTLQPKVHEKHDQNYNQLLCALVTRLCERDGAEAAGDAGGELLLRRVYTEAPLVTDEAAEYLRHLAGAARLARPALRLLEELCAARPPRAHKYAASLLCHALSPNPEIRAAVLGAAGRLAPRAGEPLRRALLKHAALHLGFMSLGAPPPELAGGRGPRAAWSEELLRACLGLALALYPHYQELIVEIARVYAQCGAEARRCVLRAMEAPLRAALEAGAGAGAGAGGAAGAGAGELPAALGALLEECPRGAEPLLTRALAIATERAPPPPALVGRVRALYAAGAGDVRLLVPVLAGLQHHEIVAALPKLIKLPPGAVREVFHKLVSDKPHPAPMTPCSLLVALHRIDPAVADLKYIIKATALCFADKHVFTQDVVSAALQQLSSSEEIPVLLLRSVLQALCLYPGVAPLARMILALLLEREVWNNKVSWEGWVKVCERLLPGSAALVAALPARALSAALGAAPALRAALRAHAAALGAAERAALPAHVAAALHTQPQEEVYPPAAEPLPPGME